jgi:hypothetical protein
MLDFIVSGGNRMSRCHAGGRVTPQPKTKRMSSFRSDRNQRRVH